MMRSRVATILFASIIAIAASTAGAAPGKPAKEGEPCAGFANTLCDQGLTCETPAGKCKTSDLAGMCVKTPDACMQMFDPVCDCDGKTHSNDCVRLMAGAQKNYAGECKGASK